MLQHPSLSNSGWDDCHYRYSTVRRRILVQGAQGRPKLMRRSARLVVFLCSDGVAMKDGKTRWSEGWPKRAPQLQSRHASTPYSLLHMPLSTPTTTIASLPEDCSKWLFWKSMASQHKMALPRECGQGLSPHLAAEASTPWSLAS
jgi:hypothetical protein